MKFDHEIVTIKRTLGKKKKKMTESMSKKDLNKDEKSGGEAQDAK